MKYDDLLNVPFKLYGRDKDGMDCYGLVLECCRRAGTPLMDLYDVKAKANDMINDYIGNGLNVRKISEVKPGAIVEMERDGKFHIGYVVERGKVLHATCDFGVRVAPAGVLKITGIYEVVNEDNSL